MTTLDYEHWPTDLPCFYQDGVTITAESRFFTLESQRIIGNLIIGRQCSHASFRNLRIEQGSVIVQGLCFHLQFENVWVDGAPTHAFLVGSFETNGHNNALQFRTCFGSRAQGFGWYVRAQTGLVMEACSADQNRDGGMLFSSCKGAWISPTIESNTGVGIRLYDSTGLLVSPLVEPASQGVVIDGGSDVTRIG